MGGAAGVAHRMRGAGRGARRRAVGGDRRRSYRQGRARRRQRRVGVAAAVACRRWRSRLGCRPTWRSPRWSEAAGFRRRAAAPRAQLRVPDQSWPDRRSTATAVRAAPSPPSDLEALSACARPPGRHPRFHRVHAERDEAHLLRTYRARVPSGCGSTIGSSSTSPPIRFCATWCAW